jgi:hypothetical protein
LGEKEEKIMVGFFSFSGAGAISGTTVMARRAGRRDRGKTEIPGDVADHGVVAALGDTTRCAAVARVLAGGMGGAGGIRGTRGEGRREGKDDRVSGR